MAAQPGEAPSPLSLAQCYQLALEASEQDQIRAENLKAAEARYRQTFAAFLPTIGLFAAQTWQQDLQRNEQRQQAIEATRLLVPESQQLLRALPSEPVDTQGSNPFVGGVSLSWPLFSGFRTLSESRARESDRDALQFERQRFRELLYLDVADVYYQLLMYTEMQAALDREERALRQRIAELQARVRLGRSREGDLLQARSDLAQNRIEFELQRGLADATAELLAFLIGVPAESLQLAAATTPPAPENIDAYLEHSGERSDLLQAAATLRAARRRVSEARGEHLPAVSLEGEYYLRERPDSGRDWRVTLRIELPVFQGGYVEARVSEARSNVRQSELELDRLKRLSDYEVRIAYREYVSAAARLNLINEALGLARANYAIQQRDYRLGIVNNLETLTALTRLHQLERSQAQTAMQVRLAEIRLHVSAGRVAQ